MITELLLKPLFALVGFVVGLIPDLSGLDPLSGFDVSGLIDFLAYGFYFFPFELFLIFISNVSFWLTAQMVWAIIQFIIRKLPFINIG